MTSLTGVSTFACYYGPNRLAQIAAYDLVIVQAAHHAPAALAALRARGVRVAAYLSIGEAPAAEADPRWTLLDPATGASARNEQWDTVFVDCRSEAWRALLLDARIPQLLELGVDGLFLDTVDVQEAYPATRPGVEQLLGEIRDRFPASTLLINRGFGMLDTVRAIADGLVFESFTSYHDGAGYRAWAGQDLAWTAQMATRLARSLGGKPVFTVDYAAPEDAALRERAERRARAYGFVPFVGTRHLDWLP
jgi:polysaccharide biosynthesis protein PelA